MLDNIEELLAQQKRTMEQLKEAVAKTTPEQQALYNGWIQRINKVFSLPQDEWEQKITELHNEFINNFS